MLKIDCPILKISQFSIKGWVDEHSAWKDWSYAWKKGMEVILCFEGHVARRWHNRQQERVQVARMAMRIEVSMRMTTRTRHTIMKRARHSAKMNMKPHCEVSTWQGLPRPCVYTKPLSPYHCMLACHFGLFLGCLANFWNF